METKVEFRYPDWGRLLSKFCLKHIGKEPELRVNSPQRVVAIFNPKLNNQEKKALKDNLPEWLKCFFEVEVSE